MCLKNPWVRRISHFVVITMLLFTFAGDSISQEGKTGGGEELKTEAKGEVKEEEIAKKDIKGLVVDMLSGEPVANATVALLKHKAVSGPDGRFTIKGVEEIHPLQITARITTDLDVIIGCSYFSVPTTYYPISANKGDKLDVQIVNAYDDKEVVLRIGTYSQENIDGYCSSCHERSPCLIEEQVGISTTKTNLKGILVKQSRLDKYIEDMKKQSMTVERYKSIRYADSHPQSLDITLTEGFEAGLITIPESLTLREEKIIICDTCHTRHIPTNWGQFVVNDYVQIDSICIKCHI